MTTHVPDDLLSAFVDGEVGEQLALHIAEHVDECAVCATRAAALEPLASAFAALDDPPTPPDLARNAIALAQREEPLPLVELGVGTALLGLAAMVVFLGGQPASEAATVAVALQLALVALGAMAAQIAGSSLAFSATTAFAVAGCAAAATLAWRENR